MPCYVPSHRRLSIAEQHAQEARRRRWALVFDAIALAAALTWVVAIIFTFAMAAAEAAFQIGGAP